MEPAVGPASPAEVEWVASQRRWTYGWRRYTLPALLLCFLFYAVKSIWENSSGLGAVVGYVIVGLFALCYFLTLLGAGEASAWRFWTMYAVMVGLLVAVLPFARAEGFLLGVYITQLTVHRLRERAVLIVAAILAVTIVVPPLIPSWQDNLLTGLDNSLVPAIPLVAVSTFGVLRLQQGNQALAEARAELARLAAEGERSRIARDLHDLLGHSLTTITVKTGLARRLGESDPARALLEIAEVESLARRSLADMRAAVSNYRDVTLAGELATGRELLRAAGIVADLPKAVDGVSPEHQELFGWVVREGLTNVVRHAHASTCAVRLSDTAVEILDDGVGGQLRAGTGLSGLGERVKAAGGVIDAGPRQPRGWRLRVALAPQVGAG